MSGFNIPGINFIGHTYDVIKGEYASEKSFRQRVVIWDASKTKKQEFGGKEYSLPEQVTFRRETGSTFESISGKSVKEFVSNLSTHAEVKGEYMAFSGSASADYSTNEKKSLSNIYTRVHYNVSHYSLTLPADGQIKALLDPQFQSDLDGDMPPAELYRQYGTHIVRSILIGGNATYSFVTDSRTLESKENIGVTAEAAVKASIVSVDAKFSMKLDKEAKTFKENSTIKVVTKGGDPQYGNTKFAENHDKWAASVTTYPAFIDFGNKPYFLALWELASTQKRRDELQRGLKDYTTKVVPDLGVPGPYLEWRVVESDAFSASLPLDGIKHRDPALVEKIAREDSNWVFHRPDSGNSWYYYAYSNGNKGKGVGIAVRELVHGALYQPLEPRVRTVFSEGNLKINRYSSDDKDYVYLSDLAFDTSDGEAKAAEKRIARKTEGDSSSDFRAVHTSLVEEIEFDANARGYWNSTETMDSSVSPTTWPSGGLGNLMVEFRISGSEQKPLAPLYRFKDGAVVRKE